MGQSPVVGESSKEARQSQPAHPATVSRIQALNAKINIPGRYQLAPNLRSRASDQDPAAMILIKGRSKADWEPVKCPDLVGCGAAVQQVIRLG